MKYEFLKKSPWWLIAVISVLGLFALFPLINFVFLAVANLNLKINSQLTLEQLGQTGDFLGGHIASFAGALSLALVLFFTFHQSQQQSSSSERAFFLEGINLITQWDLNKPGCDQSMRLLDYYSRLALKSNDKELLLILNTVITAEIRANLNGENGSFKRTNYPYARTAVDQIASIRKEEILAMTAKQLKTNPSKS
jgi:hypothetical protein